MRIDDSVSVLGKPVSLPAVVVLVVAGLMVIFLAVSALRSRSGISAVTALVMILIYVAGPAALFAYTVHCLVYGKCSVWALILTVIFVLYASIAMANYRTMAGILQNAVQGRWSLIGYRGQKARAAGGSRPRL
jgi:hypothetical protein